MDWVQRLYESLLGTTGNPGGPLLKALIVAALLIGGWLIASLLKRLTDRLLRRIGRTLRRSGGAERQQTRALIGVVASVVFWSVLIFFIALSGQLLGLAIVDRGIDALIAYLPSLVSGIVIILAGIVLGGLTYPIIAQSAESAGLAQGHWFGRIAQIAIIVAATVIGATQLGLDVSFLTNIALVVLGAIVGAFGLGLALGTPAHVGNVISARNVRSMLRKGDQLQIDDYRGALVEIGATHVILESSDGEFVVPAQLFAEKVCKRMTEADREGG